MITPVTLSLDDATLSGGAAIVAAGSGLPRRITGQIDYEALVLSLNPAGYWATCPADHTDATGAGRHLVAAGATTSNLTGCGVGGSSGKAGRGNSTGQGYVYATPVPEWDIVAGQPFACMGWVRWERDGAGALQPNLMTVASNQATIGGSIGYHLQVLPAGGIQFDVRSATTSYSVASNALSAPSVFFDGLWHLAGVRYSGGTITAAASWKFVVDGIEYDPAFVSATWTGPFTGGVGFKTCYPSGSRPYLTHNLMVWSGASTPSVAQLCSLGRVPCGTARWELPVAAYDRTLRGLQFPGFTARIQNATGIRKGVRAFYNVGGGGDISCDPAQSLNEAIPAGATCEVGFDLVHHHIDDLPYVGDYQGVVEPTVLVEEPDPPRYFAALEPIRKVHIGGLHL